MRDTNRRVSNTLVGNGRAKPGAQVFGLQPCTLGTSPSKAHMQGSATHSVCGCTSSRRLLSYSEFLLCLVVCTYRSKLFRIGYWCWPLGWKGRVSFSQCLNFIHLAGIWSVLIHILSTLAPSCVSEPPFNMHRQVWSACRCLWGWFPWSFLSSHSGHFCRSCGMPPVLVSALTGMSYISCVNVTFAVFLNRPLSLMKSDSSCL